MNTKILSILVSLSVISGAVAAKKYPEHWGDPPKIQTRDLRQLPGGYGRGSGTLAKWIQANLNKDAATAKAKPGKKDKADASGSWTPLFDAKTKTLDGWSVKSGFATYEIKDGTILGTTAKGSSNSFLCTDKQYGDFELEFEVKCHNELNSGVQIRSQLRNPEGKYGGRVNGPQVEIESSGSRGAEAGYVYGEAAGGWMTPKAELIPHKHFKDGEWNAYRVIANGANIKVWINGQMISDLTHPERYASHPRGFIGLQVHGIGKRDEQWEVSWRNIEIREIRDSKAGWHKLHNGKDLAGWTTKGNWITGKDGVLRIEPRPGEHGWKRFG